MPTYTYSKSMVAPSFNHVMSGSAPRRSLPFAPQYSIAVSPAVAILFSGLIMKRGE